MHTDGKTPRSLCSLGEQRRGLPRTYYAQYSGPLSVNQLSGAVVAGFFPEVTEVPDIETGRGGVPVTIR